MNNNDSLNNRTSTKRRKKRIPRPRQATSQLRLLRKFGPGLLGSLMPAPDTKVTAPPSAHCRAKFTEMATLMQVAKVRKVLKRPIEDRLENVWAVPLAERSGLPTGEVSVKL